MAQETESTNKRAELPIRLTRLRVKNFRSIADIDIPLSPLTVLVGPNGSGKSNVVDALRFVRDVFARGLDQAVMDREGMGVIQNWGTEGEGITIGVSFYLASREELWNGFSVKQEEFDFGMEGQQFNFDGLPVILDYDFRILETDSGNVKIVEESLVASFHKENSPVIEFRKRGELMTGRVNNSQFTNDVGADDLSETESVRGLLNPYRLFREVMGKMRDTSEPGIRKKKFRYGWISEIRESTESLEKLVEAARFYTLNPSDLRQPQKIIKGNPFDEKGLNLAAVLRHLSQTGGFRWNDLRFALRQTVSGFDTLDVEAVGGFLVTKLVYQADSTRPRTSYIGQESDGTIRILGLLAALLQEPSQPFISIEEPEANIHPGALAVLAGIIEEASLRSQILVTTHSPDMLDHLPVESFLVVEKVGDTTHVGPLDASQIASVRKRLFTPGELFRMEGLQRQAESAS